MYLGGCGIVDHGALANKGLIKEATGNNHIIFSRDTNI